MVFMTYICILMACSPFLTEAANKMVFIVPRTVRRAHGISSASTSWHQYRHPLAKSPKFRDTDFVPTHSRPPRPYLPPFPRPRPPPFKKPIPHDFDQGPSAVNHIPVSHGKHVVPFSKGLLPRGPPVPRPPPPNSVEEHQAYSAHGPMFVRHPGPRHAEVLYQNDAQYAPQSEEVHERRIHDDARLSLNTITDQSASVDHSEASVEVSSPTKSPFVLQDGLNSYEFEQKLAEFKHKWAHFFPLHETGLPTEINYPAHSPDGSAYSGPLLTSAPGYQPGYAVKEEVEELPHDFKTNPIQTAAVPAPSPTSAPHYRHDIMVPNQSIEHFQHHPLPTGLPQPGYFALAGFNGVIHG